MVDSSNKLKNELLLQSDFIETLERTKKFGDWESFYEYISVIDESVTYRGEKDYTILDILIATRAPETVLKKYINNHPPTTLTIFDLVHSRYLINSPILTSEIFSYFQADSLMNVSMAGMDSVNLLQIAQSNNRNDILRFYNLQGFPFSTSSVNSNEQQKGIANDRTEILELNGPYIAKKILAKDSIYCKNLAPKSYFGTYADELSEMEFSGDMTKSINTQKYHLQKYEELKKSLLNNSERLKNTPSNPESYFYSLAIYNVLSKSNEKINEDEYIPDFYGMQVATSNHFSRKRIVLLETLARQSFEERDRISVFAYMLGGIDGLAQAVELGVNLQPNSGEDVLHWSLRNESIEDTADLLAYLENYSFKIDGIHKAMMEFKSSCTGLSRD